MSKILTDLTKKLCLVLILLCTVMYSSTCIADDDFTKWLDELRTEALSKGISSNTLDIALADLKPLKRVVELDRNQPEFKKSFQQYLNMTINRLRIMKGRMLIRQHRDLLEKVNGKYGVQPQFLVAIWGLESNFGKNTGGFSVVQSVATLAYDARRSSFFRKQLLYTLQILDEGHIQFDDMKGSWAGAMGQLQFMPSSFISYAVDEDMDGRKDIWKSLPDIFASAANFLSSYGWDNKYTWGREVLVPRNLKKELYGLDTQKTLGEWQESGIRSINGSDLPNADITASLIQPKGKNNPSFLVYKNYRAILKWNRSHLYALAVCHLADELAVARAQ